MNSNDAKPRSPHTARPAAASATLPTLPCTRNAEAETGSLRETLIGAWQLVSCIETDVATGEILLPMGEPPQGFIFPNWQGASCASPNSMATSWCSPPKARPCSPVA